MAGSPLPLLKALVDFSNTPGSTPDSGGLDAPVNGQLRINQSDGYLFSKLAAGGSRRTPLTADGWGAENFTLVPEATTLAAPQTLRKKIGGSNPDIFDFEGVNVARKMNRAGQYHKALGKTGTVVIPADIFTLNEPVLVDAAYCGFRGTGGRGGTVLSRSTDYGPTIKFADPVTAALNQQMYGPSVEGIFFLDSNSSMTGNSPAHVVLDYVTGASLKNLRFLGGAGFVLTLGSFNVEYSDLYGAAGTGSPTGRFGYKWDVARVAPGGAARSFGGGGNYFVNGCDIEGGTAAADTHLEVGFDMRSGDGFFITNSHAQFSSFANMRWNPYDTHCSLNNIFVSNTMLDQCSLHQLVIGGFKKSTRVFFQGVLSTNGLGPGGCGILFNDTTGGVDEAVFHVMFQGISSSPVSVIAGNTSKAKIHVEELTTCPVDHLLGGNVVTLGPPLYSSTAQTLSALAAGASGTPIAISVPGARPHQVWQVTTQQTRNGLSLEAFCETNDTVVLVYRNNTGAPVGATGVQVRMHTDNFRQA